jgi:STE24 endopeptidase
MDVISLSHGINFNMLVGAASILSTTFYNYLNLRQIKHLRKKENLLPRLKELGIQYDKETLNKTYNYNLEKKGVGLISSYYNLFVLLVKLYILFFGEVYNFFYFMFESEYLALCMFLLVSSLVDTIVQLPFEWYNTFTIEENFGFNKMTPKMFIKDKIKEFVVGGVLGIVFMLAISFAMIRFKDYFIIICWVIIIGFNIIVIIIYPIVIIPLFYKLEPIDEKVEKEKEIMSKLREMCKELNFPLDKIYKMDGSTKSSHSQAFFFGVFKKRQVVLYDTLIDCLEVDEIVSVLCHEIGHWYYMHNYQMMAVIFSEMLTILYLFSYMIDYDKMYFDFGFNDRVYFMGFTIFMMLLQPILKLFGSLTCALVRRNEYQADSFAVTWGYGNHLRTGLAKISKDNNIDLNPDPLYSKFNNTHPTVLQRVEAIDVLMAKKK